MKSLKEIIINNEIIAKIIHTPLISDEVSFFTKPEKTLQVGVQNRDKNIEIDPHIHPEREENIAGAKEVIYVIQGAVEVSLYNSENSAVASCMLKTGDLFIQYTNAHSFRFLEKTKFVEIKQGSYKKDAFLM